MAAEYRKIRFDEATGNYYGDLYYNDILVRSNRLMLQKTLGDVVGDLVTICTSANINKWALYKPIAALTQRHPITDIQRKANNYGNILNIYTNPRELMNAVNSDEVVTYNPNNPNTPKRIEDFEGKYIHNASQWIEATPESSSVLQGNYIIVPFNLTQLSGDAILEFFNWGILDGFDPTLSQLNLGIIMSKSPSIDSDTYYMPLTGAMTISDYAASYPEGIRINTDNIGVGKWYFFPVYTNAQYPQYQEDQLYYVNLQTNNITWYPLWGCNIFSASITGITPDVDYVDMELISVDIIEVGVDTYRIRNIELRATNRNTTKSILITADGELSAIGSIELTSDDATIAANGSSLLTLQQSTYVEFEALDPSRIVLDVIWKAANQTDTRSQQFELEQFLTT